MKGFFSFILDLTTACLYNLSIWSHSKILYFQNLWLVNLPERSLIQPNHWIRYVGENQGQKFIGKKFSHFRKI